MSFIKSIIELLKVGSNPLSGNTFSEIPRSGVKPPPPLSESREGGFWRIKDELEYNFHKRQSEIFDKIERIVYPPKDFEYESDIKIEGMSINEYLSKLNKTSDVTIVAHGDSCLATPRRK